MTRYDLFIVDLVATTGIVICVLSFFSILAAMQSHGTLTAFWQESQYKGIAPQISGISQKRGLSRLKCNGSIFAGGIPLLITLLWLLILLFVAFTPIAFFITPVAVIAVVFMITSLAK